MICNKCGRQVIEGANFCPVCGADLRYQRNNNSGSSGYINPIKFFHAIYRISIIYCMVERIS